MMSRLLSFLTGFMRINVKPNINVALYALSFNYVTRFDFFPK